MSEEKALKYRVAFMGTPLFAAEILSKVATWERGKLVCVYTQPDRPARRGQKLLPSPVKEVAISLGVPCLQPKSLKSPEEITQLASFAPDFLLVAAYGQLLPKAVLDLARFPPLNVHGSLLPKYRGAAPVQRAIMDNYLPHCESGVSIMQMVEALDAGPVFAQERIAIEDKTADELLATMAVVGGEALLKVLEALHAGTARPVPQDESKVTYAAKLEKKDGLVRWNAPAACVHAQIRAVTSKPGAHTAFLFEGDESPVPVQLLPGKPEEQPANQASGTLLVDKKGLCVACADCWYRLDMIKPHGKAFMNAKAFVNGYVRPQVKGVCGTVEGAF